MPLKKLVVVFMLLIAKTALNQPFVGYYLGSTYEPSKGRNFLKIEETYELTIKGINPLPSKTEKRFNAQGNIVSEVHFGSTGGKTREVRWEYLNGTLLALKHTRYFVNIAGWQEETIRVEYDGATNLPTTIYVDKNGKPFQWAIITTDSLNRISSARVLDARKAHIFTEQLIYLEASNMIKVMVHRANGQFFGTWNYRLDERKPYNVSSLKRKFNDKGHIMLETLSTATKGDQAYYYDYSYDSDGNWVVKDIYQVSLGSGDRIRKKKLEYRITRSITYQ